MINAFLSALWFFMPAGIANAMPLLAARIPALKDYDQPMDFNKTFREKRIFGSHKTWRGLIFSYFATIPFVALQQYLYNGSDFVRSISYFDYNEVNILWLTLLFVVGALGADALRSFFKRQSGVKPGETWFPFDQIDYVIGGLLATSLVVQLEPIQYLLIAVIYFFLHPAITWIGYTLKIREKPI